MVGYQCSEWTQGVSHLRDLSRVGARAGITTGAILSKPPLASWFLERKLRAGYKDTFDQSNWCLMFLFCQAWISTCICQNPGSSGKQSWRSLLQRGLFRGFEWSLVNWCWGRFQEGMTLQPLGLSLWTVQETSEILIVLTFIGELPSFQQWLIWLVLFEAATASEKSCSLITEAQGAMRADLILTDSSEESDWMVEWAGWASTKESDLIMIKRAQNQACWPILEQSEWFSCMGSPATSPPLAQDGYQWEDIWVQILPWQTASLSIVEVWPWWYKLRQFVVEPGGPKRPTWGCCHQKHIAWEKLWQEGPFCLLCLVWLRLDS